MDTLGELATALGNDANFAATTATSFAAATTARGDITTAYTAADAALQSNIDAEAAALAAASSSTDANLQWQIATAEANESDLDDKLQHFTNDGFSMYSNGEVYVTGDTTVGSHLQVNYGAESFKESDGTFTTLANFADGSIVFQRVANPLMPVVPKFYFKEDGEWHPMPFSRTLDPAGDQDMDGILNANDFGPYDDSNFDGVSGDPFVYFYANANWNTGTKWKTEVDGYTQGQLYDQDVPMFLPTTGDDQDMAMMGWGGMFAGTYRYNRIYLPIVADGTTVTTITLYSSTNDVSAGLAYPNYDTPTVEKTSGLDYNLPGGTMWDYNFTNEFLQFKRDPDYRIWSRTGLGQRDGNGDLLLDVDGYPIHDGNWTAWVEIDLDDDGLTGAGEQTPRVAPIIIEADAAQSFNTTGFNISIPATPVVAKYTTVNNGNFLVDNTFGDHTYEIIGGAQAASFTISSGGYAYPGGGGMMTLGSNLMWASQPADGTYEVTVKATLPRPHENHPEGDVTVTKTFVFTVTSAATYYIPYTVTSVDYYPQEFGMFVDGATEVALGSMTSAGTSGTIAILADSTNVLVAITDGWGDSGPELTIEDSSGTVVWTESADNGIKTPSTEDFNLSFDGTTLSVTDTATSTTTNLMTWDSNTSTWTAI